jgi:L-seryl-tRNA(Ser) seleniumtransferase
MKMKTQDSKLQDLPSVDAVLGDERLSDVLARLSRRLARMTVREYLGELRAEILENRDATVFAAKTGSVPIFDWATLRDRLERQIGDSLSRAINALGVVLHTGLGRAALSESAQAALRVVSENFCNLAIDLETGRRGERYAHVARLLGELTGAEDAIVVNNNAAATMLILNTLAAGKEAVISRGQLVEIGGAFRMPDIMQRSNVKMVEVGTTNRTHLKDYRAAIGPETALLIRVHMSNYRIIGFTKEVPLEDLVALGQEFKVPVVDDLGSGALIDLSKYGLPKEPMVQESIAAGADVVCFSGDKLIGGPQSGIIVGRKSYIAQMKKNPLTRTLRCGKLTYAALEATLRLFFDEERLLKEHAVFSVLLKPLSAMEAQADRLIRLCRDLQPQARFTLRDGVSEIGGGSLATEQLPTKLVAIKPTALSPDELARRLRRPRENRDATVFAAKTGGVPIFPVFGRIERDELVLDFRTVRDDETALVADALHHALVHPDSGSADARASAAAGADEAWRSHNADKR